MSVSLAVLKRDVALGLDLMAEVLLSPTVPEAEFKRKVAQTQAAIKRSEEDPGTVAGRALARLVFPGHPYATPAEGTTRRNAFWPNVVPVWPTTPSPWSIQPRPQASPRTVSSTILIWGS